MALFQLSGAGQARAARGLISADDHAANPGRVVQRLESHDHLRRRAIRAGDDSLVLERRFGIHFGNHQRHLGLHPPIAAFIDDDAAALDGPGRKIAGHFVRRAADRQIDAVERFGSELFDRMLLAGERTVLPAERAEARNLMRRMGNLRSSNSRKIIVPTAPVAPTTAIVSNTAKNLLNWVEANRRIACDDPPK